MVSATKDEAANVVTFLRWLGEPGAGVGTIYDALDVLADRYELDDAVVLTDDHVAGVQLFRLGHRSLDRELAAQLIRRGPGLYTTPDVVPPTLHDAMLAVPPVALTLQSTHGKSDRDPVTGLSSRAIFEEALAVATANGSRYGWSSTVILLEVARTELEGSVDEPATEVLPDEEMMGRVGHALQRLLRTGDVGGRLGPARFGVLLANSPLDTTGAFVRRLGDELGSAAVALTISAGAATAPADSVDPGGLLELAIGRLR